MQTQLKRQDQQVRESVNVGIHPDEQICANDESPLAHGPWNIVNASVHFVLEGEGEHRIISDNVSGPYINYRDPDICDFFLDITTWFSARGLAIPNMSDEGRELYALADTIKMCCDEAGLDEFAKDHFRNLVGWIVVIYGPGKYLYRVVRGVPTLRRCSEMQWRDYLLEFRLTPEEIGDIKR